MQMVDVSDRVENGGEELAWAFVTKIHPLLVCFLFLAPLHQKTPPILPFRMLWPCHQLNWVSGAFESYPFK